MKEWKSRIGVDPPVQFFADVIAYLSKAFPEATLDRQTLARLRPYLIQQWRIGQNAAKAAAATCSCDGRNLIPSPASQIDLPRRAALPPKNASRGDSFGIEDLREISPLRKARMQAEIAQRQLEHYQAEAAKLLDQRFASTLAGQNDRNTARMLAAAERQVAKFSDSAAELRARVDRLVQTAAFSIPEPILASAKAKSDDTETTGGRPGRGRRKSSNPAPAKDAAAKAEPTRKTAAVRTRTIKAKGKCTTCDKPESRPEPIPSEDQAALASLVAEFAQAEVDDLQNRGA